MSTDNPAALRQHTEREWQAVKPMIETLYLRQLRPLSTLMQMMETNHQFKASTAMYKRRLRAWGFHKNRRPGTRPTAAAAKAGKPPRYLRQNIVDESLHTMLDLFAPWIAQADLLWRSAGQMQCPPRAAFIFDDFTHSIAVAAAAFQSGDAARGGDTLRQAFVDLERTLSPKAQSTFTLHNLLIALVMLNQAGLYQASRLLVAHATSLTVLRARADAGQRNSPQPAQESEGIDEGGQASHPLPQILRRLQLLAAELEGDDERMSRAVLLARSVYHQTTTATLARSISSQVLRKDYWKPILKLCGCSTSRGGGAAGWTHTIQPVLDYLHRLLDRAERAGDDEAGLVHLDEIVSVYSFSGHPKFEETALELLARVDRRKVSASYEMAHLTQWECNASLDLAKFYQGKGDIDRGVRYMARIVPDTVSPGWERIFRDELALWIREQGAAMP